MVLVDSNFGSPTELGVIENAGMSVIVVELGSLHVYVWGGCHWLVKS